MSEPGQGVFLSAPQPVKRGWLRRKISDVRQRRTLGKFVDHGYVGETVVPQIDSVVEKVARQFFEGQR